MFETETMAELCLKQGLVRDALLIYRRLLADASDERTRARRTRRIAELERRAGESPAPAGDLTALTALTAPPAAPARPQGGGQAAQPAQPAPPAQPAIDIQAQHEGGQITFRWKLPADTLAPTLQILVLRREEDGIAAERRTVRLPHAQGTLTLPIAGVHSLRAAAGKLDGDRFVPLVRLDPDP